VDDNEDLLDDMASGLASAGYTVETSSDGLAALEMASQFRPEVAVIDLGLPLLNGLEVAERLQSIALFHRPRMIAITGRTGSEHRAASHAAGFVAHLIKPVRLATLRSFLDRV
jgi:CheY-like chemotaxis protein